MEDDNIAFLLYGLDLHVNDRTICPDFIKTQLQPTTFDYHYDFFDTYERGYFIKDSIRVNIYWSIYTGYDFNIDKYASLQQIEIVRTWVTQIFDFLIRQEEVEKTFYNRHTYIEEPIVELRKPGFFKRLRFSLFK
jgi:poly-D-alanine transfer protein DltD